MITNFEILCATTVPVDYSWDKGIPLETNATTSNLNTNTKISYISGYAPALRVYFSNNSVNEPGPGDIENTYEWDFGDFYHDTNKVISLSCTSPVLHTYIMPGIYNVKLTHVVGFKTGDDDTTGKSKICRGRYGIRWFWDELNCGKRDSLTWDQTKCNAFRKKWWDNELQCFEKYCRQWAWYDLAGTSSNRIKWNQTVSDGVYQKKWMYEANETVCPNENDNIVDVEQESITKTHIVEVKELPPVAGMHSMTVPITGMSPFSVQLTPRFCKPGSFPIDRIDWDFGDGTPIKTITRYNTPSGSDIVYNNVYLSDIKDVRNYDVIHVYKRLKNTYPVFYPSLTCYAANTSTADSCSITIGPVYAPIVTPQIQLIKARNTVKGDVYTFNVGSNVAFSTTTLTRINSAVIMPNIPINPIKNTYGINDYGYFGNNGSGFPQIYTPDCTLLDFMDMSNTLTTQDSTPGDISDNLGDDGVPITTQTSDYILVY